jgi:hypothetical protein
MLKRDRELYIRQLMVEISQEVFLELRMAEADPTHPFFGSTLNMHIKACDLVMDILARHDGQVLMDDPDLPVPPLPYRVGQHRARIYGIRSVEGLDASDLRGAPPRPSTIRVRLRELSEGGGLCPRLVASAEVLTAEAEWPNITRSSISVRAPSLFLDLDYDRILQNFDLHVSWKAWGVETMAEPPRPLRTARLEFPEETVARQSFDEPVRVRTDVTRSRVWIEIGAPTERGEWIGLSDQCLAQIEDETLRGFYVILNSESD